MNPRHIIAAAVTLLGLAGATGAQPPPPGQPPPPPSAKVPGQPPPPPTAKAPASPSALPQPVPAEQIDHLSCREAWRQSGKSADQFIPMLRSLADQSLQERKLTLPSDRETGLQLGKAIIEGCVNDPEEHLSSIVDREVRKVAAPKQ